MFPPQDVVSTCRCQRAMKRARSHPSCDSEESSSSDKCSDEIRDVLVRCIQPVLPLNPMAWRRITRWWWGGVPKILLQIFVLYMLVNPVMLDSLDMLEFFAGTAWLEAGFAVQEYRTFKFELKIEHVLMDFCGPEGFVLACSLCLRLQSVAFVSFAPVCSSWVWVSRSKTGRCQAFPLGSTEYIKVRKANIMVGRCILLIAYLTIKGVTWLLEQPMNSWIHLHPLFQWLLRTFGIFAYNMNMQQLGSTSVKPTTIYSNVAWVDGLSSHFYSRLPPDARDPTCFKCSFFD